MRISDWSSDVCSSDLTDADGHQENGQHYQHERNAVYSHRPCEPAKYRRIFGELPLRSVCSDLKIRPEGNAKDQIDQRRQQRDLPGQFCLGEKAQYCGSHRHTEHQCEDGKIELAHEIGRATWRERVCQYV